MLRKAERREGENREYHAEWRNEVGNRKMNENVRRKRKEREEDRMEEKSTRKTKLPEEERKRRIVA